MPVASCGMMTDSSMLQFSSTTNAVMIFVVLAMGWRLCAFLSQIKRLFCGRYRHAHSPDTTGIAPTASAGTESNRTVAVRQARIRTNLSKAFSSEIRFAYSMRIFCNIIRDKFGKKRLIPPFQPSLFFRSLRQLHRRTARFPFLRFF